MILEGLHEKDIFTKNSPVRVVFSSDKNFEYPAHWHNAVEFVYVMNNGCTINADKKDYFLSEGDLMIIAPCAIHRFLKKDGISKNFIFQFDPLSLNFLDGFSVMLPYLSQTTVISKENSSIHPKIEEQIKEILKHLDAYTSVPELTLFLYARILDIIVLLYNNTERSGELKQKQKSVKLIKLDNAFEFIEKNFQDNITLKDAADACGFSEYYFSRIFKEATGKNFINFLNDYRVSKAEKLLVDSGISITDAAYASGFNSLVTFNRIFKKIKGLTPSAFLKMQIWVINYIYSNAAIN